MNAYYKMMITQKQNLNSLAISDDICCHLQTVCNQISEA